MKLSERLEAMAKAAQDRSDNSRTVADYLAPEIKALRDRTGHNIYAARMAVDHRNSARTDAKEAATLREAAELARSEEGAAAVEWSRDSGIACAHLRGQRVRIVPEQGEGAADREEH